jgi:hypothetical protein
MGPVSLVELKSLSEVTPETLVWYEGLPSWVRAGDLPELFGKQEDVSSPSLPAEDDNSTGTLVGIVITIFVVAAILMYLLVKYSKA